MNMIRIVLGLIASALILLPGGHAGGVDCPALGFSGLGSCSDCEKMGDMIKDAALMEVNKEKGCGPCEQI
jgi:hypothetical protein